MLLVGHVVPKLSITSLIGIKVLCNTRCKVVITKTRCDMWYKGSIILKGSKDPSVDLWTLPLNAGTKQVMTTNGEDVGDYKSRPPDTSSRDSPLACYFTSYPNARVP